MATPVHMETAGPRAVATPAPGASGVLSPDEMAWGAATEDARSAGADGGPLPNGDPPSLMLWGDET